MPTPSEYQIGESWEYVATSQKTGVEEYRFSRTVEKIGKGVVFDQGKSKATIESIFGTKPNQIIRYQWPLEVGKSWDSDFSHTDAEGIHRATKARSEVVALEEISSPIGPVKAY